MSTGGELRRRKGGVEGLKELVEELDAFTKVVDDVKEEKSAASGIISFICFFLITVLCLGELHSYFFGTKEFDYRFDVDIDYRERPTLDIDMVVATPCSGLVVMPMGDAGAHDIMKDLSKDPTRFEFTPDEQLYWTVLRHAFASQSQDGFRGLDELMFVDDDVESNLAKLADEKQQEEKAALIQQRKDRGENTDGVKIFLVGNGLGVFHLVASSGGGTDEEGGQACRIHGTIPVSKGKNNKILMAVGDLGFGNIIASFGSGRKGNVSHRIERFHFGRRVGGLVTPLAGAEQISPSGREVYRYFVKVVPTRIYHNRLFGGSTLSYQYSVTFLKKHGERDEYPSGAIVFEYEFTSTIIEIREVATSLLQLLLRLCSVVGGVFATSCIINGIVQTFIYCFFCSRKVSSELPVTPSTLHTNPLLAQRRSTREPQPMAPNDSPRQFSYLPKILNGGFAGIVGVTCVFPIDLVKTRLQNQRVSADGKVQYTGILDCARQTWRSGGASTLSKVGALYSGSGVNILLITPEKAIKLVANDFFRHKLSVPGEKKLSAWRGMVAGGSAGFCQIIVTTPMELLKIQMQDQGRTNAPGIKKLTATQLTINLLKEKGIAGLYRGLGPTMARDVTFSVIYFPLFAQLDSLGPRKADGSGDAVFWTSFVAGLASGAFSSFAVTPLDVIKTRIQLINQGANEIRYKGIGDAFVKILSQEGPKALFKGAACRMLVMAPLFGIAQTVYYIGVAEYFLGIRKDQHI